jgi:hypothetical protein
MVLPAVSPIQQSDDGAKQLPQLVRLSLFLPSLPCLFEEFGDSVRTCRILATCSQNGSFRDAS